MKYWAKSLVHAPPRRAEGVLPREKNQDAVNDFETSLGG